MEKYHGNRPCRGEIQESWMIIKDHFLQAQKRCIPMSKKSGKGGKRPMWMNKDLSLFEHKQETHRRWKQVRELGRNTERLLE